MNNRNVIILACLLVRVAYADEILPTLPPLIQVFGKIQSCIMTVYLEQPQRTEYKFINGRIQAVPRDIKGEKTFCCKGWEDAAGTYEGPTPICAEQQSDNTPYVTTEEYNDVLGKVAEIRSAYEHIKALETATALAKKAEALNDRVSEQEERIRGILSQLREL